MIKTIDKVTIVSLLSLSLLHANQAQTIVEKFAANSANEFQIEFVTIGNPGNAADSTSFGSVAYTYNLGKFEISADMIAKANSAGALGISYETFGNKPATAITWNEAARFVNWLNTSKGYQAAYNFTTTGANDNIALWSVGQHIGSNQFRHKDAYYFLPSADEWYKGAYYDPSKTEGAGYWKFATGSDIAPQPVSQGTEQGSAVYNQPDPYGNASDGIADVDKAGGLSPFGTMGQAGNALEWVETASDFSNDLNSENRDLFGGSFASDSTALVGDRRAPNPPDYAHFGFGFRVAMVPEPSAVSLLAVGLGIVLQRRRRTV